MSIMITGGAGYIGSHCCVTFLEAGHDVVVLDNLSNANPESLERVSRITGAKVSFVQADIRDGDRVEEALKAHGCTAVVHFAGLKVVGDSLADPLGYYDVNVTGTLSLVAAMKACDIRTLIFSSSANVYGNPVELPLKESHRIAPMSPYGETKHVVEQILADLVASDPRWRIAALRYFNPVGAHETGLIGESPLSTPTNLMPIVTQVATGKRSHLQVFGSDYDTPDGTGIRDFIHVMGLSEGHLAGYRRLEAQSGHDGLLIANLGTGRGYSVMELVKAFEHVSNRSIPLEMVPRRAGDIEISYADPTYAKEVLGWSVQRDLTAMCHDTWNWVCKNPNGYAE